MFDGIINTIADQKHQGEASRDRVFSFERKKAEAVGTNKNSTKPVQCLDCFGKINLLKLGAARETKGTVLQQEI